MGASRFLGVADLNFHDPDRIFDAIIYTSKSDHIMRYSDEVHTRLFSIRFIIIILFQSCGN